MPDDDAKLTLTQYADLLSRVYADVRHVDSPCFAVDRLQTYAFMKPVSYRPTTSDAVPEAGCKVAAITMRPVVQEGHYIIPKSMGPEAIKEAKKMVERQIAERAWRLQEEALRPAITAFASNAWSAPMPPDNRFTTVTTASATATEVTALRNLITNNDFDTVTWQDVTSTASYSHPFVEYASNTISNATRQYTLEWQDSGTTTTACPPGELRARWAISYTTADTNEVQQAINAWTFQEARKDVIRRRLRQQIAPLIRTGRAMPLLPQVSVEELKARDTLRDMLTEKDWRRYVTNGFVMVKGGKGWYQVFNDQRRIQFYQNNKLKALLCIHTDRECPPTDHIINLKILIELDEESVWKGSNVTYTDGPLPSFTVAGNQVSVQRTLPRLLDFAASLAA